MTEEQSCYNMAWRGYFWEFLVGVSHPVFQTLTPVQTKKSLFHTRFQTWPVRNYHHHYLD